MIRKIRKHFLKLFIAWVVLTMTMVLFVLRSEFIADKVYHYAVSFLEENLQSKVEMKRPEVDWLRGNWRIKDVSIWPNYGKETREFIKAKSVRVSFLPWWYVLKREIAIRAIEVEDPVVYLKVENGRIANLPSLEFLKERHFFRLRPREIKLSEGKMSVDYPEKAMGAVFNNIDLKVRLDIDKDHYGFFITKSSADIKVGDLAEKIISLKGNFSITPGRLTVLNTAIDIPEGSVSAEGLYLDFATARWNAKGSAALDMSVLKKMAGSRKSAVTEAVEKLGLKGKATVSATIEGDEKGFYAKAAARFKVLEVYGLKISDIDSKFSARFMTGRKKIDVSSLAANMFGGLLKGRISLDLEEGKGFRGKFRIGNVNLKELSGFLQPNTRKKQLSDINGRVSGDIDISGEFMPELRMEGSSDLNIRNLGIPYGGMPTIQTPGIGIKARISYAGGVARIGSLIANTPFSTVSVSGDIADKRLSLGLQANISDLSELTGRTKGSGILRSRVSGTISDPRVDGSLDINNISWGRYHADAISGTISFNKHSVSSPRLILKNRDSSLSLKGEIPFDKGTQGLDVSLELKKGRVEDLISMAGIEMETKGDISLKGRARGSMEAPDGEISVTGSGMSIMGEEIDSLGIEGRFDKGKFLVKKGEALRNGDKVAISGDINTGGDMNITVSSSPMSLGNFHVVKKDHIPFMGIVRLNGQITGNIENPSFSGKGILRDVLYGDTILGNGDVEVFLANRVLTASGGLFGANLTGTLVLKGSNPFTFSLEANDLLLNPYFARKASFEGLTGALSGKIKADGELSRLKDISAKAYISKFQIVREPFLLKNAKDIEVELREGKITVKSFRLNGRGTQLDASGWMGIDGKANIEVKGNMELSVLELFADFIRKGGGIADIGLTVSGKPLRIGGEVVVRDGIIGFKGFDPLFTDISAAIALKGESLVLESLSGKVAEGRIKGEGNMLMSGLRLKRADMSFDLSGVHLAYPKWLPSELEGNLRLAGDYPSFLLSGDINVVKARYSERVDWKTFLPSFKSRLKEPSASLEGEGALKLDISFKADRNLIFENNVGKGELRGELRLKGDTSRFGILGDVEVITGKVFYKEYEFSITSGVMEFADPKKIEPILDFSAEGKVRDEIEGRDYDIQILVQGNMNDPKVTMTSTPFLSELDIASLVSLGVTSKGLQERGGGAPAYGAASLVTREMEGKFKDYIGFDRFHIDPYYSKVSGTTEPKLTVGKELTEDTSITYSRGLSGTGEQEAQMEYRLFRNFSLIGGWSSFGASREGDLGADMKFRFEFR